MSLANLQKPAKGTWERERKAHRRDVNAEEKKNKAAVRRRDRVCRWPGCDCRALKLRTEVAHIVDKSRGGSSATSNLILLCVSRHQGRPSLHSGDLEILTLTNDRGADGPCQFYEGGEIVGRESSPGVLMKRERIPEPEVIVKGGKTWRG